jgi:hypothetical protein
MKIGKLVQSQAAHIFRYCQDHPDELSRLMDREYSKRTFKLNWPFCCGETSIPGNERERYWTSSPFSFNEKTILVCSQWYRRNRNPFCSYLASKGIISRDELPGFLSNGEDQFQPKPAPYNPPSGITKVTKTRYKATAEGDAANLVIRAILSNLGMESFTRHDWEETKAYFLNRCAYYDERNPSCDEIIPTHRDHIIPINKTELGEHRIGNLVPCCNACNKKKHHGDFRSVFADRADAISRLEAFIASRGYTSLGDNALVKIVVDQAHSEVKALVHRYISIIEAALPAGNAPDQV